MKTHLIAKPALQRPQPPPPSRPEKANKIVRRAKSAVAMRGNKSGGGGNGGSRIVPRFRIFGSSAGGGRADIAGGSGCGNAAAAEVRPRAAVIARSVSVQVATSIYIWMGP